MLLFLLVLVEQPSMAAADFFSRVNTYERSKSYDASSSTDLTLLAVETETEDVGVNVRRAVSLRTDQAGPPRRGIEGLSFTAAGATLSPQLPLASRHALFSHHRVVSTPIPSSSPMPISAPTPPSPSASSTSSAFSPASAFLSRFSSTNSIKPSPSAPVPDGPGAVILGYTLGKVLGRGGFSTVRLATNSKGEQYACKIVKRDDLSDRSGSLEKFEEEIRMLKSLPRHPSLLPLLEMERTEYATFLITPALLGGNLLDVLRRDGGSDKTARKWFPGVVGAVSAMHEGYEGFKGGMLHGDLKLENFLVDQEGRVVVCDFYMAQLIIDSTIPPPPPARRPRSSVPTHLDPMSIPADLPSASLPYAPPELLSHPPAPPSLAQDIWALGVLLYALLTGKLPFVDAFDPRLQMKILRGQWEVPYHLGKEWVEVLQGCLDGNRCTRWTIERVKNSDAVIGWKEVKARSRSRSRRRVEEWADPLTSRPRDGRSTSRGPIPQENRGTSRSRSNVRRGNLETEDVGLDRLQVRGRSPHIATLPGLSFARSADEGGSRTPTARSRSTGRRPQPNMSHSPNDSLNLNLGSKSHGQNQSAYSPSDSMGDDGRQRSRSRTPWGEGRALGVVDEEVTERGRRGRR